MSTDKIHKLGAYIYQRRTELGLTMREVAAKAKLHHSTISDIESGAIAQVTLPNLQKLAFALDVDYEDLATLAGHLLPEGFPTVQVYLRAKYDGLSDEQIDHLKREVLFMLSENEGRNKEGGHGNAAK